MLFDKIFHTDIERLKSVDDMWKSRQRPESLKYETVFTQATEVVASRDEILANDQRIWSLEENLVVFKDSLGRLSHRMLELKNAKNTTGTEPIITFDKDDVDTLDFVASSANIRSTIFGIDRKSRFEIKEMAGNIIPAIATTNAIVAGLCVLEAFKVLKEDYNQAKEVRLNRTGDLTNQSMLTHVLHRFSSPLLVLLASWRQIHHARQISSVPYAESSMLVSKSTSQEQHSTTLWRTSSERSLATAIRNSFSITRLVSFTMPMKPTICPRNSRIFVCCSLYICSTLSGHDHLTKTRQAFEVAASSRSLMKTTKSH